MQPAIGPFETPRSILPHVLVERGLTRNGVEVGVCEGIFSEHILHSWPGVLWLVDPWEALPEYPEAYPHDENYLATLERLKEYEDRYRILRMTSLEAANTFDDGSMDFVYIDANHTYEGVKADLEAWYPKIKPGGLFAGDDYGPLPETPVDFGHGRTVFGVKRAVDEFALKVGRNVSIDWLAQWWIGDVMARNWWFIK